MPGSDELVLALRSTAFPRDAHVTVRVSPAWVDVECVHRADTVEWAVTLPLPQPPGELRFKFLCDGEWQVGDDLVLPEAGLSGSFHVFDDRSVQFPAWVWPPVDSPLPAQRFFSAPRGEDLKPYDVIIVGSGAGGGTLAHSLVRRPKPDGSRRRVLVLEAGSYLFPTHVGNLPRRETTGSGIARGIWELWYDYRIQRWQTDGGDNDLAIAQGLNLGGRSLFWGALAPRMRDWEFSGWPSPVPEELRTLWYPRAEQLMRVHQVAPSAYQTLVRETVSTLPQLSAYTIVDAPVATEYAAPIPSTVPTGVFSTAELLIERKLQLTSDGQPLYPDLQVRLHQEVLEVESTITADGTRRAERVLTYDHESGQERRFSVAEGGTVVLAAGTLGTPLIAGRSDLTDRSDRIGHGLTDHPIYVVKFTVGRGSRWYTEFDSAMVLSRPNMVPGNAVARPDHPFNAKLSLNTRLTQSRFVEPDDFPGLAEAATMPCELVFMQESPLREENRVQGDNASRPRPVLTMTGAALEQQVQTEMDRYADAVLAALDGTDQGRSRAPLGGVGHEVGTMRMGRAGSAMALVDEDLLVSGSDNVYVCDLSVFPSSPAANPTLTLVALALRLAEKLP